MAISAAVWPDSELLKPRRDPIRDAILSLSKAVEARDRYTEAHTSRVAEMAVTVGQALHLPRTILKDLFFGAAVHDVGKLGVPDSILLKPAALDPAELEVMRQHPLIGAEIVRPLRNAGALMATIRHHHENVDGTGYPDHLRKDQIPLSARIVSVCDAFDALTTDRPYRQARSVSEALDVLIDGAGRQWDPAVVSTVVEKVAGREWAVAAPKPIPDSSRTQTGGIH